MILPYLLKSFFIVWLNRRQILVSALSLSMMQYHVLCSYLASRKLHCKTIKVKKGNNIFELLWKMFWAHRDTEGVLGTFL